MTQRDALIAKNYIWAHQKNKILRSKFFGRKLRWKKFPWDWKIELATNAEYDLAWSAHHEKLYLTHQKINFKDRNFLSEIEVKKFLWNWKIELAKNARYDSAWSADNEKLYFSPSKNQFLRSKFFRQKLRLKNFFEIGKSKWLKMQNMTQRDALITKNYIWANQKINC